MAIDVKVEVRDYDDWKPCPICGAQRGEPCRVLRSGKRERRAEPHFYRERDQWR